MSERLFKVLDHDRPIHGGDGRWSLPTNDGPGDWMPPIENIELCKRGYHLCRVADLVEWPGPDIYEAEWRGERIDGGDKIVVSEARLLWHVDTWTERTARLFACDCAEHVLHIYEARYPDDMRPREAVAVARRYANGEATDDERAAAGATAWAAAGAAAWAAAWDAAWDAAWAAAGAAAWAAAWDAAWDAAWAAAWAAEREWQMARLMEYLYPQEAA